TGATGLVGTELVGELLAAGAEVTVLSRDPERAAARFAGLAAAGEGPRALRWDPLGEPAPAVALEGREAVVHLAGENIARRWSESAKHAIRESRVRGTAQLLDGLRRLPAGSRPAVLVSASAVGYYGAHGEEPLDEDSPPGHDFLAQVCVAWEAAARAAEELGLRTVQVRTGVVLNRSGGALAKMLPPSAS